MFDSPTTASLQSLLQARWHVDRAITDARNNSVGAWEGNAIFRPHNLHLLYTESGILDLDGMQIETTREYRYVSTGAWAMNVQFTDGRPFHDLDLSSGQCSVEHHCGNDHYRGEFQTGIDNLSIAWRITGPHKDLYINSRYELVERL